MVVLGLILILLGLLIGAYTVMGGLPPQTGADVELSFLGLTVQTSAVVVFALGALTLLLLELGVLAMRSGARRSAKRRAEFQRLRRVEAEIRNRESAEVQRNATATSAPAAAPFARRDTSGDTGSNEAYRSDRPDASRPDTSRPESYRPGADGDPTDTRRDLSAVRPPESGTPPTTGSTGSTGTTDLSDGSARSDRP